VIGTLKNKIGDLTAELTSNFVKKKIRIDFVWPSTNYKIFWQRILPPRRLEKSLPRAGTSNKLATRKADCFPSWETTKSKPSTCDFTKSSNDSGTVSDLKKKINKSYST
jgi:hypothetical protein